VLRRIASRLIIQPDRLERFIRAREAVQDNCRIFQNIMDNVIKLETLESDSNLAASQKTSEGFEILQKNKGFNFDG